MLSSLSPLRSEAAVSKDNSLPEYSRIPPLELRETADGCNEGDARSLTEELSDQRLSEMESSNQEESGSISEQPLTENSGDTQRLTSDDKKHSGQLEETEWRPPSRNAELRSLTRDASLGELAWGTPDEKEASRWQCIPTKSLGRRICWISIFALLILLIIAALLDAVRSYGTEWIRVYLQKTGFNATGVSVNVESVHINPLLGYAQVRNTTVYNPPSIPTSPYFLRCERAYGAISWWRFFLSQSKLVVIEQLTVHGLVMYIDHTLLLSNAEIIMQHIQKDPLAFERVKNETKGMRFIVEQVRVHGIEVHTQMTNIILPIVYVPPLDVSNIGAKQNGVKIETLIGMLVQAFAKEAIEFTISGDAHLAGQQVGTALVPRKST